MAFAVGLAVNAVGEALDALRLIAVYAASCLLALWLAHRFLLPFSRRIGAALLFLPLILTGRAVFTGGFYGPLNIAYGGSAPLAAQAGRLPEKTYENGILTDVIFGFVPWRKVVRESFAEGRWPLLNRFIFSGDVLLASMMPAAFHPNTLIGLLLSLPAAWTFTCAFTLFLAGLCAFLYLRSLDVGETAAFFGAAVWTLSGVIAFFVGYANAQVLAAFPLLNFGLHRLASGRHGGFLGTVSALVLMVLGGHPESLLLAVSGAGVIFCFELGASSRRWRAFGGALLAGVLALGITAAALLPFVEALLQTVEAPSRSAWYANQKKSLPLADSLSGALTLAYPRSYESVTGDRPRRPHIVLSAGCGYVGGLALAFAALGLVSRRRERWGLLAAGLSSAMVATNFPGVTDAVTKLPLFDIAIYEYFIAIASFCLAALAALGLDEFLERKRRAHFVVPVLVTAALLLIGLWWRTRLAQEGYSTRTHELSIASLLEPVVLFLAGAAFWRPDRRPLGVFAVLLLLLTRSAEIPRLYPTFSSRLFYPEVEELRRLPAQDEPYRVTGLGYAMIPNQSPLYELEDPRGTQAMTNMRYWMTYPLWCVFQPVSFNRIDDPTRPFLSFLNVRFAIAGPEEPVPAGWREFARGKNCALFENPTPLPRAFAPERIRFVRDGGGTVEEMKSCADFSRIAWIEDPRRNPGEIVNGPAEVTTKRDGPDLSLDIRAESPSWIVVSQTAWKGWKAFLGGERIPIHFANHAFLGFQVPSGSHRVRLLYRPDSFRIGLAVSVFSIAAVSAVLLSRRRKGEIHSKVLSEARAQPPRSPCAKTL